MYLIENNKSMNTRKIKKSKIPDKHKKTAGKYI